MLLKCKMTTDIVALTKAVILIIFYQRMLSQSNHTYLLYASDSHQLIFFMVSCVTPCWANYTAAPILKECDF
jgi:hypothetical protein